MMVFSVCCSVGQAARHFLSGIVRTMFGWWVVLFENARRLQNALNVS